MLLTVLLQHYILRSLQINSQIVYGIKVLSNEDPYVVIAEEAIAGVAVAGLPGAFLVDTLPIRMSYSSLLFISDQALSVKYVPEWIPGAGFQRRARVWRKSAVEMNTLPFEAVNQALVISFCPHSLSC